MIQSFIGTKARSGPFTRPIPEPLFCVVYDECMDIMPSEWWTWASEPLPRGKAEEKFRQIRDRATAQNIQLMRCVLEPLEAAIIASPPAPVRRSPIRAAFAFFGLR